MAVCGGKELCWKLKFFEFCAEAALAVCGGRRRGGAEAALVVCGGRRRDCVGAKFFVGVCLEQNKQKGEIFLLATVAGNSFVPFPNSFVPICFCPI